MTKKELEATIISRNPELKEADVKLITDLLFDKIKTKLVKGYEVGIPNFGKFKLVDRAPRISRNPLTGESIKVPAKRGLHFANSKAVKDILNEVQPNSKVQTKTVVE